MFTERLAIANPNAEEAAVDIRFLLESGDPIARSYLVPGQARMTVDVNAIAPPGAVSAVVDATSGGVAVERTMFWGEGWYGGHTGKAVQDSRTQWYLAEGDAAWFDTWILLANPGAQVAHVTIDYLLEGAAPIRRTYDVGAEKRVTVYANGVPGLAGRAFSTSIDSDQPINVERAMYFDGQGKGWVGGHEAAAVAAPATDWFVAEGCTGPLFDTFLLLANPGDAPVDATLRFLTPSGIAHPADAHPSAVQPDDGPARRRDGARVHRRLDVHQRHRADRRRARHVLAWRSQRMDRGARQRRRHRDRHAMVARRGRVRWRTRVRHLHPGGQSHVERRRDVR